MCMFFNEQASELVKGSCSKDLKFAKRTVIWTRKEWGEMHPFQGYIWYLKEFYKKYGIILVSAR